MLIPISQSGTPNVVKTEVPQTNEHHEESAGQCVMNGTACQIQRLFMKL